MSKAKNSDKEIDHDYCSCGEYLYSYSENQERIRVAKGRKVTIYLKKRELEIVCPHCEKIIKVKF